MEERHSQIQTAKFVNNKGIRAYIWLDRNIYFNICIYGNSKKFSNKKIIIIITIMLKITIAITIIKVLAMIIMMIKSVVKKIMIYNCYQ